MEKDKWNFGQIEDDCKISIIPSMPELYIQAMNSREYKREMYERAINAALENLFLWERSARADGFVVDTVMGVHNGDAHPVFSKDGLHVTFMKAYGAIVKDMQEMKSTPEDLAEIVKGKKDIREVD